ncbi:MAG TPA: 30S ribosomal protein S17 [Verrucomicrobiae bacterium]|nr:30S ribosomal protein S17 [Verrucomicrobiae bacterium]
MEKQSIKRTLIGDVVSNKAQKTVIVEVENIKIHPKYHKRYKVSKKYPAHVESGEYQIGDRVEIQECPPVSKTKNFVVIRKIS